MKKGKWNYTEDIEYTVLLVGIEANLAKDMHWQNAFVGQTCQIVKIIPKSKEPFFIDNEDGSGLLKIQKGGGPDSYSAHLDLGTFAIYQELLESEWNQFDEQKHKERRQASDDWVQANFPVEFERLQRLKNLARSVDPSKFLKK